MRVLLISLLVSSTALAGHPKKPPPAVKVAVEQSQAVEVHQVQDQTQNQTASAVNDGNSVNVVEQSSAPSVSQGSFAIAGCALAGNAGGSKLSGSAFLGFAFTPKECYKYLTAQAYQAVGQYEAACQILNTTRTAKDAAKEGVKLPDCVYQKPIVTEPSQTDTRDLVTKEELRQSQEALLKAVTKK